MIRGDRSLAIELPIVWRDLMVELRQPLAQIRFESLLIGHDEISDSARHTLRLIEGFVMASDLIASPPELSPSSIQALTDDVLNDLDGLAKSYGIKVETTFRRSTAPVALNKQVYQHAVHGIVYSSLTALQNSPGACLKVNLRTNIQPQLGIFSPNLDVIADDLYRPHGNLPRSKPSPLTDGIHSGFVLADNLLSALGSRLEFVSNQHGKGFKAAFSSSRQMSIMDSLVAAR